jgi:ABC-2 type transport system permease protein/ribosome-dependent ATPase
MAPLSMFLLFGYGFTMEVRNVPMGVVDRDGSALAREYAGTFLNTAQFRLAGYYGGEPELFEAMRRDDIRAALVIPADFSRDLLRGRPAEVQLLVNGTIAYHANTVKGYLEGLNAEFNRVLLDRHIRVRLGRSDLELTPIELSVDTWYNPALRSEAFLVPANVAFILYFFSALFAALAIARERESGSILAMYASPMGRLEYLAGKIGPYVAISFINFVVFFLLSVHLFEVRFRGDLLVYLLAGLVYIVGVSGLGVVISLLVRSQVAVIVITTVFTMVTGFLYSDYMVPVESMTPDAQAIAAGLPITYFMRVTRVMFLKGPELGAVQADLAFLAGFTLAIYALMVLLFRKRIG